MFNIYHKYNVFAIVYEMKELLKVVWLFIEKRCLIFISIVISK